MARTHVILHLTTGATQWIDVEQAPDTVLEFLDAPGATGQRNIKSLQDAVGNIVRVDMAHVASADLDVLPKPDRRGRMPGVDVEAIRLIAEDLSHGEHDGDATMAKKLRIAIGDEKAP